MGAKIRLVIGILGLSVYYILSGTGIWADRTVHLIFGMLFGALVGNSLAMIISEKK
jgi:hypothetical protein